MGRCAGRPPDFGRVTLLPHTMTRSSAPYFPMLRGGAVDESPWPTEPTGPVRAPNFWKLDKPGQQVLADARAGRSTGRARVGAAARAGGQSSRTTAASSRGHACSGR